MAEIPEGDWLCQRCRAAKFRKRVVHIYIYKHDYRSNDADDEHMVIGGDLLPYANWSPETVNQRFQ